ncbi:MAG: histidine phosphatase family protein [Planctomycetota bacterium]
MNEPDRFRIIIVRPGLSELDEQGRIAGNLDVPLSEEGKKQANQIANELKKFNISKIVSGPTTASNETAEILATICGSKVKLDDDLKNFDCGLWHGKRIEELKETQPKIFKLWQEQPSAVSPPNGENLETLTSRVQKFAKKITKKPKPGTIVVVAAEPVATTLRSIIESVDIATHWSVEPNCGSWFEVSLDLQTAGV